MKLGWIEGGLAAKLLKFMFAMLGTMNVAELEDEDLGSTILSMAGNLNVTLYDAAYLTEA